MPISSKQERIYSFIKGYISSNKYPPTLSEIGRHFDMRSSASVHAVLAILKREGLIEIIPNISRGVRLVDPPQPTQTVQAESSEMVM